MRVGVVVVAVVALALGVVACGGSGGSGTSYSLDEVKAKTDLVTRPGDLQDVVAVSSDSACDGLVLLGNQIGTYKDAGDTVVENNGGTVGVKVYNTDPGCQGEMQQEMDKLP